MLFAVRCFPCSCAVTTKDAFPHAIRGLRRVLGVQCRMLVCRACAPVRWHCASRCMRRAACTHFPMRWCRPSQATAVAATRGVPARTCTCTFCATSVSRASCVVLLRTCCVALLCAPCVVGIPSQRRGEMHAACVSVRVRVRPHQPRRRPCVCVSGGCVTASVARPWPPAVCDRAALNLGPRGGPRFWTKKA